MKLASHYNRSSILITIIVLLVGGIIYYFAINYIATQQLDQDLTEEIEEVNAYVQTHNQLPTQVDFDEEQTVFVKTGKTKLVRQFYNTTYNDVKEKKVEEGRAVSDLITLNNEHYKVVIVVSRESSKDLIELIMMITLLLMLVLLLIIFITNKYVLSGLWKPFYETLAEMKRFNVSTESRFNLKNNDVDEFMELNIAAHNMSVRATNDFQNLKHFTESASHEMMTPLAVVTTKLDTLIQDERLCEDQLAQITEIYASINKSTRLNHSLLLLAKLDNNLINDTDEVNVKDVVIDKIAQFQESIQNKQLTVTHQLTDKSVTASKYLIDVLINNLMSNAIRHNNQKGEIEIILSLRKLTVINTGDDLALPEGAMFDRFKKGQRSQGTGLGLTLVKNICQHYGFCIHYQRDDKNRHLFMVIF